MKGLVDIILPTHRRPHTLGYAMQAVLQQTYPHWRLHVIGDGCDDRTAAVVVALADPRITFYRFPKAHGFGYAHRNTVLQQTAGEFIAYATDDDLWFPDHLAQGLAALEQTGLALAAFRSAHVQYPDVLDPYFFAYDWRALPGASWLLHWFVGSVECVHRRSVFAETGFWNDQLFRFGDREFHHRVRASSLPTSYFNQITVLRFYAQHWDEHYAQFTQPPQAAYLPRLSNPQWCEQLRAQARAPQRDWTIRQRQWQDFMAFGLRSGPKFIKFWWQKWRSKQKVKHA